MRHWDQAPVRHCPASLRSGYIHRKARTWFRSTSETTEGASTCKVHAVIGGASDGEVDRPARALGVGGGNLSPFDVCAVVVARIEAGRVHRSRHSSQRVTVRASLGRTSSRVDASVHRVRSVTFWQTAKRCGPRPTPQLNKPNQLPSDTRRT